MTVSLLCRGESLEHINLLPQADVCVLVNAFHYELENDDVHNYVSNCKEVIHVVSLGAQFQQMIENDVYRRYNFTKIVLPYVKDVLPNVPDYIRNIQGPDGTLPVHTLSDINKQYMISTKRYAYTAPTAGLDALLYTTNELEPTAVNIIGMDFYDNSGYMTNSHGRRKDEVTRSQAIQYGESTDSMKKFLYSFVNRRKDIIFNLYTNSTTSSDLSNLNVKIIND